MIIITVHTTCLHVQVSQLNDALKAYCSQHEMISFIDLRPYLRGTNDTLIDRTNLSSDGLHYSKKGIATVAKALVYETDKVLAEISNKHALEPPYAKTVCNESWPDLPEPSIKPNVRPAAYPGEQFRTVVVTNRMKTSQTLSNDQQTAERKKMKNHSEQSQKMPKRVEAQHSPKSIMCTMRSKKQFEKPTRQNRYIRKVSTAINANRFHVPTSNRYDSLEVEEIPSQPAIPQITLKFPTLAKKSKRKSKALRLYRKRKVTKLECAARATFPYTSETVQPRRTSQYTNPHRTSEFKTLKWTKGGFVQTVTLDECTLDMTGCCVCYTFGRHKHATVVFRQSCAHIRKLLLLCGDIETNPVPSMKKQSTESKRRKQKMSKMQETEEERIARLDKRKEYMKEYRDRQTSDQKAVILKIDAKRKEQSRNEEIREKRVKRLQKDANLKSKSRSEETHDKRARRLKTVAQQMSKSRSEKTPEKRAKRLKTDAQQKSKSRYEETPETRAKRLKTVTQQMSKLRSEETPEKRVKRLRLLLNKCPK